MKKANFLFKRFNVKLENGSTSSSIVSCTIVTFVTIMIFFTFITLVTGNSNKIKTADGFTISSYSVYLDVDENNVVDVSENVLVDWYDEYHHGIYKFTPEWLKYTGKDGKTIKRKSKVLDYEAIGDEYSVDKVNGKPRIKIGSANEYVDKGEKLYQIHYTYDMGSDPYKNGDEFIFHAFGDYWGTEIKNASICVTMPKDIEECEVNFFADKYRENNVNDYVHYDVDENMLFAAFDSYKYLEETGKILDESLTVDIELPEGYFSGGHWNYGFGSAILCFIVLGATVVIIALWEKYGKDLKKRVMSIQYYPPDSLSSAEIGYAYGNKNQNKLAISLIISLAAKEYIKIDDTDDKKIKITSLIGIEPKAPNGLDSMVEKRKIVINKLKNNNSNLSKEANTMMKYLFKKGRTRELIANFDKFTAVKDELINNGYIEIVSDNTELRWNGFEKQRALYDQGYDLYKQELDEYNSKLMKLEPLNSYEKTVFNELFKTDSEVILSEHKTFYKAINAIKNDLDGSFKKKIKDIKSSSMIGWGVTITIASFVLSLIAFFGIEDMDPTWSFLYVLAFMCVPVNFLFTIFMGRKTEYGEELNAKIRGFREFLNTAEKPDLERLVESNPKYFYNILPYTYVLNVSKVWITKFENIPINKVDMGSFDYSSDSNWNRFSSDVYVPYSSGSSSGGSSCGGGCSSCGGGCSSCGGGGSW